MKFTAFFFLSTWLMLSCAFADENPDGNIWFSSAEECIVSKDTVGISIKKQNIVVIRYSYEDRDSLDCYVITSLPDIKSLKGNDFFYSFVASFLTRSLIWSRLVVGMIDTGGEKDIDNVWADVEGILRAVQPTLDPQPIILRHKNYAKEYEDYYENAQLDSYLINHANFEKRPEDGWLHFTVRVKKNQ